MIFQHILFIVGITTLSLLMLVSLQKNWQLKHITKQEKIPAHLQLKQLWVSYFSVILIFCFIQNADYVIAFFYVIFVSSALFLLLLGVDKNIIAPQEDLYQSSKSLKKLPKHNEINDRKSLSTFFFQTLRTINLVLLSPLIGAICGIFYRAFGQTNEVNLLVFTALIASLCYAICLVYFSCTRRVGLSSLIGCGVLFTIATCVALSQKVVLS